MGHSFRALKKPSLEASTTERLGRVMLAQALLQQRRSGIAIVGIRAVPAVRTVLRTTWARTLFVQGGM